VAGVVWERESGRRSSQGVGGRIEINFPGPGRLRLEGI
jgi:hypothetical protein